MTRSSLEIRVCDRCGARQEIRDGDVIAGWATVQMALGGQYARSHFAAVMLGKADVCAVCLVGAADWWAAGKLARESDGDQSEPS